MSLGGETTASLGGRADEAFCSSCSKSFGVDVSHCPHDGTKLVRFRSVTDSLIGKALDGRFQILEALGEGGMGAVYRGLQLSVDREVAVKVIHASVASDREVGKRFLREARLASRLSAATVVSVIDFGQSDEGVLFLVMELVKGRTLQDVLVAAGSLAPQRVVRIALQLCDALDAAHKLGIVHRDLKPGNVIVLDDPPGRDALKVLDFGLAKSVTGETSAGITSTNALLGTPIYMAPEQIEGGAVDGRTDLYALGCILQELLSGSPPFVDGQLTALLANHLHSAPPPLPPHVPPPLQTIVYRLLAKAPADRFGSAGELREALAHLYTLTPPTGIPIQAPVSQPSMAFAPTSTQPSTPSMAFAPTTARSAMHETPVKRRWPLIAGIAALGVIAGVIVLVATRSPAEPSPSPSPSPSPAAPAPRPPPPEPPAARPPDPPPEVTSPSVPPPVVDPKPKKPKRPPTKPKDDLPFVKTTP